MATAIVDRQRTHPPVAPSAAWRDIAARAATMAERRSATWFNARSTRDEDDDITARLGEWCMLTTSGDRARFEQLLLSRDLSLPAARDGLRGGTARADGDMPAWAHDLALLFFIRDTDAPAHAVPVFSCCDVADDAGLAALAQDPDAPWELQRIFARPLALGAMHLDDAASGARIMLAETARHDMLAFLARRLGAVCTPTFVHRVTTADVLAGGHGVPGTSLLATYFGTVAEPTDTDEAWPRLLSVYPVLGRVLAVAFRQWSESIIELLGHLDDDGDALRLMLGWDGAVPLARCSMGAGDLHAGGRSVGILTFGDGSRVVHKPKDLRVTAEFMTLITRLNDAGLQPPLRSRAVVCRTNHTWEAFVTAGPCRTADEVSAFYERMGMLIRLVQLLDGTDFTVDNVLADGPHPELIDLEMLLSPRLPGVPTSLPVDDRAQELSWDTPARSGLVTAKVRGEAFQPYAEVGALALPGPCRAPFRQLRVTRSASATVEMTQEYPLFPPHRATPMLDGRPATSTEHREATEHGYTQMHDVLVRQFARPDFRDWFVTTFVTLPVRFLCRDTHIYARMLQASLAPRRLMDGRDRELLLERLWRAHFPDGAVIASEVRGLADLDIPYFTGRLDSSAVCDDRGTATQRFFRADGPLLLDARIDRLVATPRAASLDALRAILYTLAPAAWTTCAAATGRERAADMSAPHATRSEYRRAALAIGDAVLRAAVRDGRDLRWVGVVHDPVSGSADIAPLTASVVDGLSGIGLALSRLAIVSGEARFATAARSALDGAWRLVDGHLQQPPSLLLAGADFGWPGALAACWHGAARLGATTLQRDIVRRLDWLAARAPDRIDALLRGSHDTGTVATGLAGSVLALAPLRRVGVLRMATVVRRVCKLGEAFIWAPAARDLVPEEWAISGPIAAAVVRHVLESRRMADIGMVPGLSATMRAAELCVLLPVLRRRTAASVECVHAARALVATITPSDSASNWLVRARLSLASYCHTRSVIDAAAAHRVLTAAGDRTHRSGRWMSDELISDCYRIGVGNGLCGYINLLVHGSALRPCGSNDLALHSQNRGSAAAGSA